MRPVEFPLGADGEELLEVAAELYRQTRLFLIQLDRAARNADPGLLRSAGLNMRADAYALFARHRELVGRLLDGHPLAPPAPSAGLPDPGISPRGETPPSERTAAAVGPDMLAALASADPAARSQLRIPTPAAVSPRGETANPGTGQGSSQESRPHDVSPRGETAAPLQGLAVPPSTPRGETPAMPAPAAERRLRGLVDQRLAQQGAVPAPGAPKASTADPGAGTISVPREPMLRGLPRGMDVNVPLDERIFGHDWALAGWTVQPDVLVVLGEGHHVGWVERGLDGGDGWVAVHDGYFLGDPTTQQAILHATPELAARTIHQAHVHDLQAARRA